MKLVLPLLFFAVAVGLSARRMTPMVWFVLILWIALLVTYTYFKH